MQFVRPLQIDYSGQRNRARQPDLMRRQTQRQLRSRRMSQHDYVVRIEVILLRFLHQQTDMRSEYPQTFPAILHPGFPRVDIPRFAVAMPVAVKAAHKWPKYSRSYLRSPISAMNANRKWMRSLRLRHPQIHKLILVTPVCHARISLRRRQTQNVIAQ